MNRLLFPFDVGGWFIPLFMAMWCLTCWICSTMGGWRKLATQYRAVDSPQGRRFRMQSGRVGLINYGGCLTIHTGDEGLHLATNVLFQMGHPPLFIPWSAVHNPVVRQAFGTTVVKFTVGSSRLAHVQLSSKVFAGTEINMTINHSS